MSGIHADAMRDDIDQQADDEHRRSDRRDDHTPARSLAGTEVWSMAPETYCSDILGLDGRGAEWVEES